MAKFVFKLQAVLRQRELFEHDCQRKLAEVEAERVAAMAELKRLDDAVKAAMTDLCQNQLVGHLNLSFLAGHRRFILAMQRQGVLQMQQLDAAQKKVNTARATLAEAAKQRRMIEKLRERQQAAWAEAMAQKETAALDEVSMQMTNAAMREQGSGKTHAESEPQLRFTAET